MFKEVLKNKKVILFIITLLLSIISYSNFLPEFYSVDTVKILKDGYMAYGMKYSIQDARIFSFLIFCIAEIINISLKSLWQILFISAIIISSISVIKVYDIIIKIKPSKNTKTDILIYIISYCFIFNFMYIDALEFAENLIIASSILCYIKSAEEFIIKNRILKGLVFCIVGILFYQGTLNLFIATVIIFLLITKTENKKEKKKKRKLAIIGIISIIIVLLDLGIIKIVKSNMSIVQNSRLSWNFTENITILKKNTPNLIINSVSLFPKYLQISLIGIVLTIVFIQNIIEKKPFKIIEPICIIAVCYLSTLGLSILTPGMLSSINGRMFISTGIIISALFIYAYLRTNIFESKKIEKIIKCGIIIYFSINTLNTINVTRMLKEGNNIDREISYEIQQEIMKYESETQIQIKYLAVRYRNDMETDKKWLRSRKMFRAYNSLVYETYTGEKIEDTTFQIQVYLEYFNRIKNDIKCINDTVYVLM